MSRLLRIARIVATLLVVVSSALPTAAEERLAIMGIPPWSTGPDTGILADITAALFAGIPAPEAEVMPPRRIHAELGSGHYQWLYWPCHMRPTGFGSVGVLATDHYGLVLPATATTRQLTDMRGRSIGVWSERLGLYPELEQDTAIEKVSINAIEQGLLMLQARRLDAIAVAEVVYRWHAREHGWNEGQFRYLSLRDMQLCLFAADTVPAERVGQLQARLHARQREQVIEQILARYR